MRRAALALLFVLPTACAREEPPPPAEEALPAAEASADDAAWATLEAMAEKYADASAALADGFIRDPSGMCVTAEMVGLPASAGAMGVHYLHPARLGMVPDAPRPNGTDGVVDLNQPEVLVYEPQADGSERLVAVEYLVFQEPWAAAGNDAAPELFGEPFVSMIDDPSTEADEAHGFEPHYELHVWFPRDNPTGRFAEFNPAVSCANAPMGGMADMG